MDIDELLVSQPDYGEQALEIADMLVRSGAVDVVAVDSVAALTPRAELEGQMGDQTVGLQARMMSQAMRKLAGNLNRTQTLCLFANQIREKVGVMFGSPETQPGGRALKFYSSQRLDIRRIETLKDGTEAIGNRVRVKVVKNKVAAPFRQAEFDIEFGKGISTPGCILDLGIEHSVVTKSGSFFSYGDERLGQGRNNAKALPRRAPRGRAGDRGQDLRGPRTSTQDLVQPIERDPDAPPESPRRSRRVLEAGVPATDDPEERAPARARSGVARAQPARPHGRRARAARSQRKRVEPAAIEAVVGELLRAGLPRRRPLRPALRRGPPAPRRLGRRADRAQAALARHRRRADRRRDRRAGPRGRARSGARPAARAASPTPPATPRDRERALGMLVRKGYELELAHDALRRHAGAPAYD